MDHLKRQSEKEKERLLQKMRDMREEIISEKVSLNKRITERSINLPACHLGNPAQCYKIRHTTFNKAMI